MSRCKTLCQIIALPYFLYFQIQWELRYCKESIDNERMVHTEQTGMTMKGEAIFLT